MKVQVYTSNGSLKKPNRFAPEVLQRKACFPQANGTNTCGSQLSSGEAHIDQCLRWKYGAEFCQVKSQHIEVVPNQNRHQLS